MSSIWIGEKLIYKSKIKGPKLSFWIRYICVAQRKFDNLNLITEVKKNISIDQCLGEYFLHVGNSQRKGRHWLTSMIRSIVNSWWIIEAATGKFCKLYPSLISETVFLALELTQICYLHYICNKYKQFFLKPGNL